MEEISNFTLVKYVTRSIRIQTMAIGRWNTMCWSMEFNFLKYLCIYVNTFKMPLMNVVQKIISDLLTRISPTHCN